VNDPKTYRTRTGRTLSEEDLDALADEVEHAEYDVDELKSRRRGRPPMGSAAAEVVPVRIDPELRAAIEARAQADHTTTSEVIRRALRRFLDVA
jgi:Arc/MetJ-type ribon-helix-helix transcriptional regulator